MPTEATRLSGIFLPLITPFNDSRLDEASLRRLTRHYAGEPLNGLILAATTGEELVLDNEETAQVVGTVAAENGGRLPLYLGLSGSDTRKLIKALGHTTDFPIDGYLIACPYYTRPSQEGLFPTSGARRTHGASDPHLQHPVSHRRQSRQRDDAAAGGAHQHRGRQGLLRRPCAVLRPRPRAAIRLCRADGRGRIVSHRSHARCGWRHLGVGPCGDCRLCARARQLPRWSKR